MKIETVTTHVHTYVAIDGTKFTVKEACEKYEASLPRHKVFILEEKISAKELNEIGYWHFYYKTFRNHKGYRDSGFLREGGEYEYETEEDNHVIYVKGALSDAIAEAVEYTSYYKSKHRYYTKMEIVDLT